MFQPMRGTDTQQSSMFSYLSPEERVPANHPLRPIRLMVDDALKVLSPSFSRLYSAFGRPSIAPEKLLRALLLQVLYTVRSERMLMEQLEYNHAAKARRCTSHVCEVGCNGRVIRNGRTF